MGRSDCRTGISAIQIVMKKRRVREDEEISYLVYRFNTDDCFSRL